MKSPATALTVLGGLALLAAGTVAAVRGVDRPRIVGLSLGTGLGALHLVASRALDRKIRGGKATDLALLLVGSFFVRIVAVAALVYWFVHVPAVDALFFAIGFLVLYFVYLALEIGRVRRPGRTA